MSNDLEKTITRLWEAGDGWRDVMPVSQAHATVRSVIEMLDKGEVRVAEVGEEVTVNEWVKLAILMWFRVREMQMLEAGPFEYVDKLPLKTGYLAAGVRVVPGASARFGAYLAPTVVMMPSYVNIGAYVDEGTMIDTWATVASCAQIGKRVHLSGGVGIGGVLEPPNAVPVVIEDDAMIFSRSMVVEGARVRTGAVLGAGTILTKSSHVIDVETGEELPRGEAPAWSVCVGGTRMRKFDGGEFGMPCVLVLKRLAEGSPHDKAALNDILRDHGVSS
jgi:2,3,4,5-tetrahydropyridine-2,6-dicarboxylate N-succinyltransferase